jgi:hypothetical protein
VRVWVYFCTCNLNPNLTRIELGLGTGFVFIRGCTRNLKKNEIRKKLKTPKPEKNSKPKKNPKNFIYKTQRAPEIRRIQIQMSNFTHEFKFRCQIQPFIGWNFFIDPSKPDICHPYSRLRHSRRNDGLSAILVPGIAQSTEPWLVHSAGRSSTIFVTAGWV